MRISLLASVAAAACMAVLVAPARAVVTDDFESYTVGDAADVANPAFYSASGGPLGSIGVGTATANVPSSQVLVHNPSGSSMTTLVSGPDVAGDITVEYDFMLDSVGSHNVWFRDADNGADGILIRTIAGDATRYFLQVQGNTGSNPPAYEALINYGEWIRATVNLHIDANPALNTFDVTFFNLTQNVLTNPHAGGNGLTSGMFPSGTMLNLNQIRIEAPNTGVMQYDNFVIPEPASMALLALGAAATAGRRRTVRM